MKHNGRLLTLLALIGLLSAGPATHAQTGLQQPATEAQQSGPGGGDPIRQLNLTPEQREQIRAIRESNRAERTEISGRLRDSNLALEEALNADNPDESLVEQRVRDVAAAQAAAMRMRILTEIRIRRVLTVEQRATLRSLQLQAAQMRRERKLETPDERQKQRQENQRGMQNQRNGLGPILPRNQRRNPQ